MFHSGLSHPGHCSCLLILVPRQQLSSNGRVPEIHLLILDQHFCLFGNPVNATVRIRIVHSRRRVRCDRDPRRMRLPLNPSGSDPVYYPARLRYIIDNRKNIYVGRTQILVPLRLVKWKVPVHNLPKCFQMDLWRTLHLQCRCRGVNNLRQNRGRCNILLSQTQPPLYIVQSPFSILDHLNVFHHTLTSLRLEFDHRL